VIEDPARAAARAVAMVTDGAVETTTGQAVRIEADTLCVHGDTPGAVAIARAVRAALGAAGVTVAGA
jgi:UPF0271 protein